MNVVLLKHVDKLRECGSNPHALFILYTLDTLIQNLLDDEGKVGSGLLVLRFTEVHKYGDKGCLSVGGKQCNNLILYTLYTAVYLFLKTYVGYFCNLFVCVINTRRLKFFYNSSADFLS